MPRARWRDWFLGSLGVGKPVKPMAEPMTKPVEGQIGVRADLETVSETEYLCRHGRI